MSDVEKIKDDEETKPEQDRIQGRVLVQITIDGQSLRPNQVVSLPVAIGEAYEKSGEIDLNEAAVEYALKENSDVVVFD